MTWVAFALLGPFIFTIVNYIDRVVVERYIRDPLAMPVYVAIASLIAGLILWVLNGFPILATNDFLIIMLAGISNAVAASFYFRAIVMDDTSKVVILMQMSPVAVLILSFIVLDYQILPVQFIGFVLVLGAALALSVTTGAATIGQRIQFSRALWFVLGLVLFSAISNVLFKFVVDGSSFGRIVPYESFGMAFGGLLIYIFVPTIRQAFNNNLRSIPRSALLAVSASETVYIIAKLTVLTAISLGPVALVSVLSGTQVFYAILLGWLLTKLLPRLYNENIARGHILRKIFWALVLFVGVGLIYLTA